MNNQTSASSIDNVNDIILPGYMFSLSNEEITVIKERARKNVIIACGYHYRSRCIIILDENTNIREFIPELFFEMSLSIQKVIPIKLGSKIEITTSKTFIEIDAEDVLKASSSIDISNLEIDMIHENKSV